MSSPLHFCSVIGSVVWAHTIKRKTCQTEFEIILSTFRVSSVEGVSGWVRVRVSVVDALLLLLR